MPTRSRFPAALAVAFAALIASACSTGLSEEIALDTGLLPTTEPGSAAMTTPNGDESPFDPGGETATTTTPDPTSESTTSTTEVDEASGFTEVFFEDFDGNELDPLVWGYESPFVGANEGSVHVYQPEAITLEDGVLQITASRLNAPMNIDTDGDGSPDHEITWQSGFITSRDRLAFTYGRFEIRARIPAGQGLWPAFWLRPQDRAYGQWPASGEIDVFEVLGHEPNTIHWTAHWADGGHEKSARSGELPATDDGFRTFVVEWTPEGLQWSVDGVVTHELLEWTTSVGEPPSPFDGDFYLNVNLAVGGNWPGPPDETTPGGAALEVDWIRVSSLD